MTSRTLLIFAAALASARALALPSRVTYIDIEAGLPQLVALQAAVRIMPRWQLGASYGILPGGIANLTPKIDIPEPSVTLADGNTYALDSQSSLSLDSLSPFVRFFPAENNFYFQLTYTMWRIKDTISADLVKTSTGEKLSGVLGGNVTLTQVIPTLSIGHLFASELFFLNLSIGAAFLYTSSVDVSLSGVLPDSLGGQLTNQTALNKAKDDIRAAVLKGTDQVRKEISVIPSLSFSFGMVL